MDVRKRSALAAALLCASLGSADSLAAVDYQDHYEFEAALAAPYTARADFTRDFGLSFRFPGADDGTLVAWRLDVVNASGVVLRSFRGENRLIGGRSDASVRWDERDGRNGPLPWGHYTARLTATPLDLAAQDVLGLLPQRQRIDSALEALAAGEGEVQEFQIEVGHPPRPAMPAFAALRVNDRSAMPAAAHGEANLSAPAAGGLPYTVYYGNLHSQTNHSDGGGTIGSCDSEQAPQSGTGGPAEAYQYALNKGLDILMTSEHNHMFDGSTSTNASANPTTAKNLFASGLSAAASFNSAHPGFLGVYGLEWGVISNGGHMNLFNVNKLLSWEYNSSNQLIGDVYTAKSDYAALYTTMKANGWIGQFNHPATSGQFIIGSTALAYSADGDAVMVLAEVTNSSAFSNNTTETETSRSSYEGAWKILLERGFHVAPSSDQDNHCANWGASYTNRTAVLIPTGTSLSQASFIEALKARRVFATTDKTAQLILTANGHVMGERFSNSGSLSLTANYAHASGHSASTVQIYEGVPGRNGTATVLSSSATATTTPATGEHYYFAKITQDNGTILWSAPIWVSQGTGGGDTTPPTVSASESGSSGTISFSATASDASGVSKVEFYVDGALKATDTSSPYSASLDSTTLANGSHSLTAKAYDPSNNVGTSSAVSFSVSNSSGGGSGFSETESNGTVATANAVARSYATISGTMGNTTDKDYFALSLNANETLAIAMTGPASTDYDLYLVDASDATLKSSTASGSTESLSYTNGASAKTVYAKVIAYSGSSTTSPYTLTLTYTAGSGGGGTATELVSNGGFESGATGWTATSGVVDSSTTQAAHAGSYKAWLNGYGSAHTDSVYQQLTIPSSASTATLSFWLKVVSDETTTTSAYDTFKAQVRNSSGTVLATLGTWSNLDKGSSYVQRSFDVSAYKGQTIQIYFVGVEGSSVATSFLLDDVSLKSQ